MTRPPSVSWALALATASVLMCACKDQDPRFTQPLPQLTPMALGTRLLLSAQGEETAHLIDASAATIRPTTQQIKLPVGVRTTVARAGDHDEVLFLSVGERSPTEGDKAPPSLTVLSEDGSQRRYAFESPFDTLVQSSDGRYVILYRLQAGDRLLNTATEVAIVDLDRGAADGVTLQALSNLGETPRAVEFGPPMDIAGETRRLAVIYGERKLALLDVSHPGRRETAVELTSDLARNVSPLQVLFDPTAPRLFVRAAGASDMYSLRLLGPVSNPGGNDFRPTIDLIDVGGNPQSAVLTVRNSQPLLIAANGAAITLVDVNAGTSQRVPTPLAVTQTTVVNMASGGTELVLWSPQAQRVLFGALDEIQDRGDRALELSSSVSGSLQRVEDLPGGQRLLGLQAGGMVVIDPEARTVTPLSSRHDLRQAVVDDATGRVWVAPQGQPAIGFLELDTGATGEVLLDDNVTFFTPLPASGRIAVSHALPTGHITFLEAATPTRDTAQAIRGFLATDLLD